MSRSYNLHELATLVGGSLREKSDVVITGVADLSEAGPTQATWASNEKYAARMATCKAGVVLVPSGFGAVPIPVIECKQMDKSIAALLGAFTEPIHRRVGKHPSAVIHPSVSVGEDVYVGPNVVIEAGASIGARTQLYPGVYVGERTTIGVDCLLWANVVVRDGCRIGDRVMVHPCAVIGADGFGYYFDRDHHEKIPHSGGVVLEDDVEIGACTCVDRSKFGNTIVARGAKIDNLVQIAHNVRIGAHCAIAALTGVSGSVRVGDYCVMGGAVRITDNVELGAGARLALCATVTKDIPPGLTASGFPAQDHRTEMRQQATLRKLPEFVDRVRELITRVEKLEASTHDQS